MEFSHTLTTRVWNEAASMSVFCSGHPLATLRPRLAEEGIVTAKELRRIPSGSRVRVTGMLVIVHTPPTRSGKRVMFITMEDETGLMDLVMFPKAQQNCARPILTSEVVTVEGRLQREGKNGISISIVVEKVIPSWTGLLLDCMRSLEDLGKTSQEPTKHMKHRGMQTPPRPSQFSDRSSTPDMAQPDRDLQ